MPIYEFFCKPCNTIFSFFSRKVDTTAKPRCPRCSGCLERRVSMFSFREPSKQKKDVEQMPLAEKQLQEGMQKLGKEVERLKEEDPAQADRMLQRFTDMTGVRFNEMYANEGELPGDKEDPDREPSSDATNEPLRDSNLYEL